MITGRVMYRETREREKCDDNYRQLEKGDTSNGDGVWPPVNEFKTP